MDENTDKIFSNLNDIFNKVKEISDISPDLGKILLFNFKQSFDIYEALIKNEAYDISDQIKFVSDLLKIDIYQMLKDSSEKDNVKGADDDITSFILNNSKVVDENIEEYEKFIKESLKEVNASIGK